MKNWKSASKVRNEPKGWNKLCFESDAMRLRGGIFLLSHENLTGRLC
jgi:hypothetical protein